MIPARIAALLSIALPLTPHTGAQAQEDKGGVGAAAGAQEPVPPGDLLREDDIIVTADRYGEARVAAEAEFSEEEITAQGTDSIEELVARLTPFIGNGDEEPILLINGKPADGDRSILSYPAEALNRLAVLKPEAAAQYGYASGKRVVNLVLKKSFASLNVDAGVSAATGGGQYGGRLSAGRVAIDGAARWNVQARIQRDSALLRSARDIPPDDPLTGDVPGGPGADPGDFETLLPSRRSMGLNAGITRPLGDFSASLNVNASSTGSNALRGLPGDSIGTVGGQPLRSDNSARSLGTAFNLTGRIDGWQTSFAANYSRSWSESLLERGLRDDALVLTSRNRARGENMSARFNASKAILDLPAGPLTTNISGNVSRNRSSNHRGGAPGDPITVDDRTRVQTDGQVSFNIPLSRDGEGEIWRLGDLALDLSLGAQTPPDSGLQKRFAGGLSWTPVSIVQLRGSLDRAETAPTFDQLDGPLVTTIERVFDFAQAETVDVIAVTGGNPALARGSRQSLSLSARVLPFDDQTLALNLGYRAQTATGGLAAFPELTPVIETAFPERVTRDAEGRLVSIDARPINIARDATTELTSGIALRLPRRGGRGPGGDPVQFSAAINHRWRLKDELLTRTGVPVIDQLAGGGQSRHSLSLQAGAGTRGIGTTISANWGSPARVRSGLSAAAGQDFRFEPPVTLNLSAFIEPEHVLPDAGTSPWMKNAKFSLDVQNLLNGYRQVTLGDGSVPPGYSRDEIDPLGRTIRLTVRKRF